MQKSARIVAQWLTIKSYLLSNVATDRRSARFRTQCVRLGNKIAFSKKALLYYSSAFFISSLNPDNPLWFCLTNTHTSVISNGVVFDIVEVNSSCVSQTSG